MARNRVIYQSEALFVSPNATGAHFTCTAVETGLGPITPFGGTPATQLNGPFGETGNAPKLMSLVNPIGLNEDPAVTWSNRNTFTNGVMASARSAGLKLGNLSAVDMSNISGAAETAADAILADKIGRNPISPVANSTPSSNGAGSLAAAVTRITANTGKLCLFSRADHWENALSGYFNNNNSLGGGTVIDDKDT